MARSLSYEYNVCILAYVGQCAQPGVSRTTRTYTGNYITYVSDTRRNVHIRCT